MNSVIRKDEQAGIISRLLSGYSTYVRQQFDLFLRSVRENSVLDSIISALRDNSLSRAFDVVDTYVTRLGDSIVSVMPVIGRAQAQAIAADTGLARAGASIAFDPASPQVIEAMQRNRLDFITSFSNDQRLVVVNSLAQSMREGVGIVEQARRIRDVIGLTSYQQGMVNNYQVALQANNRRALEYSLRDRRYDTGFENAIAEDELLSQSRINLMVDRYRDRLLQLRGETIARTETARVAEEARAIAVEQVLEETDIPRSLVVKQWIATGVRTRSTHGQMHEQARLFDEPFDSPSGAQLMQPGDSTAPAAEIVNCRCSVKHHIFQSEQEAQDFLQAYGQGKYS